MFKGLGKQFLFLPSGYMILQQILKSLPPPSVSFFMTAPLDDHKPEVPSFRQATPTEIEEKVTQCNKTNGEQSMKQTVGTTKTKDTKKTIQNDQSGKQNQEQKSKQTTMKGTEIQSKQLREQNQEKGPKSLFT